MKHTKKISSKVFTEVTLISSVPIYRQAWRSFNSIWLFRCVKLDPADPNTEGTAIETSVQVISKSLRQAHWLNIHLDVDQKAWSLISQIPTPKELQLNHSLLSLQGISNIQLAHWLNIKLGPSDLIPSWMRIRRYRAWCKFSGMKLDLSDTDTERTVNEAHVDKLVNGIRLRHFLN